MIVISTVTGNSSGSVRIREHPETKLFDERVRMSRTATLDGGCLFTLGGFSDGDRTFDVRTVKATEDEVATLETLFTTEGNLVISTIKGVFEGVMDALRTDRGDVRFTFKVKEALTA